MIRWLIVRILGPLVMILIARSLIVALIKACSQFFGTSQPETRQPPETQASQAGGELKKDPVCGTYVSPGSSVSKRIKGNLVYFCSPECRDKYVAT